MNITNSILRLRALYFSSSCERAEKNSWHCPTCALVLILFCLAGCNPAAEQTQAINNDLDVIHVPEGGTVNGQRVHEGLFMTRRKIDFEVRRITNAVNKKLLLIDEQETDRLWEASTR